MTLSAHNITAKIAKQAILTDVSLTIIPGQVSAIIGPNGAGKSTLLRTLSGEVAPDSGEVLLDGKPLITLKSKEIAKHRAVLPQSSDLSFAFTVMEIVLMGRLPHSHGFERPHDYVIAHKALQWVEMQGMAERIYTTLSGGERQRVQLARILTQIWDKPTHGNRYLLMDEPTNNLDLTHQHSALQIANQLAKDGVGVLVILHDLNLVAQYAQHITVLHHGCVLTEGTPYEVLTAGVIQEAFNLPVTITNHPHVDCPLVIANPTAPRL